MKSREKAKDKDKKPEKDPKAGSADGVPETEEEAAAKDKAKPAKKSKKQEKPKKKSDFSFRRLLFPLVPFYKMLLNFREMQLASGFEAVQWVRWPVISIGSLSDGGSGKTPFVIALAQELRKQRLPVDVLSKGAGSDIYRTGQVDPNGTAEDFGDEQLLIAREAGVPVFVAPQLYQAGLLAERFVEPAPEVPAPTPQGMNLQAWKEDPISVPQPVAGSPASAEPEAAPAEELPDDPGEPFSIHLLNDGFQQRQLARHVDILLINRRDWMDRLLPAGHLREPHRALFRANAIAIPYSEPELEEALRAWDWQGPIWRHRSVLDVPLIKEPVTAFCGIARPSQFFEGLETVGLKLVSQHSFPNHFAYTRLMVKELIAKAFEHEARAIVTTSKDIVRLGTLVSLFPPNMPLINARLRTEIANVDSVIEWLAGRLG